MKYWKRKAREEVPVGREAQALFSTKVESRQEGPSIEEK
jgi:hypothetical protein